MNRINVKFTYRVAAALLLASILGSAFVWTRTAASEPVASDVPKQKFIAEAKRDTARQTPEAVTLRAERRGYPLMNLRDGKKFET